MPRESWFEARSHALRAVAPDERMRTFFESSSGVQFGLLFTCKFGVIDFDNPKGDL